MLHVFLSQSINNACYLPVFCYLYYMDTSIPTLTYVFLLSILLLQGIIALSIFLSANLQRTLGYSNLNVFFSKRKLLQVTVSITISNIHLF